MIAFLVWDCRSNCRPGSTPRGVAIGAGHALQVLQFIPGGHRDGVCRPFVVARAQRCSAEGTGPFGTSEMTVTCRGATPGSCNQLARRAQKCISCSICSLRAPIIASSWSR